MNNIKLLLPLAIFFVNSAWAIPNETVTMPTKGHLERTIDSNYYDLTVNYDLNQNGRVNKLVCILAHPFKTYVNYTYQNQPLSVLSASRRGLNTRIIFTENGKAADFFEYAKECIGVADDFCSAPDTMTHVRVADKKGQFNIHVITQPGSVYGNYPVSINCSYVQDK